MSIRIFMEVKLSEAGYDPPTISTWRRFFSPVLSKETRTIQRDYYTRKIQRKFKPKNRVAFRRGIVVMPTMGSPAHGSNDQALSGFVGTDGAKTGNPMYAPIILLEEGTKIRYRIMSRGWKSKTTPNSLAVGSGSGKAGGWGVAPGIDARNWRDLIVKERFDTFEKDCVKAFGKMGDFLKWE